MKNKFFYYAVFVSLTISLMSCSVDEPIQEKENLNEILEYQTFGDDQNLTVGDSVPGDPSNTIPPR